MKAEIKLEPHDIWVGVYWFRLKSNLVLYICILPCLPLRLEFNL